MTDWNVDCKPPCLPGITIRVYMDDGSVRNCKYRHREMCILFTDCNHPEQNAYCNIDRVVGWKILDEEPLP